MPKRVPAALVQKWLTILISVISPVVDELFEEKPISSCYCWKLKEEEKKVDIVNGENEMSETLHSRNNLFREMVSFFGLRFLKKERRPIGVGKTHGHGHGHRWSDCGCETCGEWLTKVNDLKLHVAIKEPEKGGLGNINETENVIFLHGFVSSSSIWAETVFPNLSPNTAQNYRLFALDLLGFGRSPKPWNCFYTISDHIAMIDKSMISPYQLNSFHLVAHSMGCVIALALAARYIKSVKSIILVAPASSLVLEKLAPKRVWPPLIFGSAFISWYEHLGRCVCFIICRHHKTWEWILKLVTGKREVHFTVVDLTRHTHHSAWHSMHNVICGGAKLMDGYLESLVVAKTKLSVFQGDVDEIVPLECSKCMKFKVPNSEVTVIRNGSHNSVILGREIDFTKDLENVWGCTS